MAHSQILVLRRQSPPVRPRPLAKARVLIVDRDWATGVLLRDRLEQDYGTIVDVATSHEEALDLLGNATAPTHLVMLDPALPALEGDAIVLLLRQHQARIAVTLHGRTPPESLPFPDNFIGAAAYTHLATSAITCAAAEAVVAAGLTVDEILTQRRVPTTLDRTSAFAIYRAAPGERFPLSVRP